MPEHNPFDTDFLGGGERYVWNVRVHAKADEWCRFFRIRFGSPSKNFHDALIRLLKDVRLDSHSVYVLYGRYDYLIRTWATNDKVRRFVEHFRHRFSGADFEEFVASRIDYRWANSGSVDCTPPTVDAGNGDISHCDQVVNAHIADIHSVCRDLAINKTPHVDTLATLLDNNLIYRVPNPTQADEITEGTPTGETVYNDQVFKFFIALERVNGRNPILHAERDAIGTLIDSIQAEFDIDMMSWYEGTPDSYALAWIKGVTSSFSNIYECAFTIAEGVHDYGMRPETYIVASTLTCESDHADCLWQDLGGEGRAIEHFISLDVVGDLLRMPIAERRDMIKVFEDVSLDDLPKQLRNGLRQAIEARIRGDREMLQAAAQVTTLFESYIRRYFQEVWHDTYPGDEFYKNVVMTGNKIIANHKKVKPEDLQKRDKFNAERPNLMQALAVTNSLPEAADRVAKTLGKNWYELLESIVPFRNDAAHGNILDPEITTLEDWWTRFCQAVLAARDIFVKLHDHHSENSCE